MNIINNPAVVRAASEYPIVANYTEDGVKQTTVFPNADSHATWLNQYRSSYGIDPIDATDETPVVKTYTMVKEESTDTSDVLPTDEEFIDITDEEISKDEAEASVWSTITEDKGDEAPAYSTMSDEGPLKIEDDEDEDI